MDVQTQIQAQPARARWYLISELVVLFIVMPLVYLTDILPFHKIIPLLLLFVYCTLILLKDGRLNLERLSWEANWKRILLRFAGAAILLLLWLQFVSTLSLWADFSENKKLFYMVLMYPLVSVFPQELIYREFFFYRYSTLIRHPGLMMLVNVLLFSFAHIYFQSLTVVLFTLAGGLLFALTFMKTRSLLVVTIEHSLYGLLILSTGLADYFYKAF